MTEDRRPSIKDIGQEDRTEPAAQPDAKTREWEDDLDRDHRQALVDELTQNIGHRKLYAALLYGLLCFWLLAMVVLLFFQGFGNCLGFYLSDPVLIAALATTTVNIIALFVVVAKYIFPSSSV